MMYQMIYASQKWNFDSKAKAVDFARLLAESKIDTVTVIMYEIICTVDPTGDVVTDGTGQGRE